MDKEEYVIRCPHCGYIMDDYGLCFTKRRLKLLGKAMRCPKCYHRILIKYAAIPPIKL